jgi:FixJ family two-component response regulator
VTQPLDHPPTVFVVDDDPEVRQSLRLLLLAERMAVETYESAHAFLNGHPNGRAGCLVLDLRMPGMSGLELMETLAAQNRRIPTIVISASGDRQAVEQAKRAGVIDFLRKPYDPEDLLKRIRAVLDAAE